MQSGNGKLRTELGIWTNEDRNASFKVYNYLDFEFTGDYREGEEGELKPKFASLKFQNYYATADNETVDLPKHMWCNAEYANVGQPRIGLGSIMAYAASKYAATHGITSLLVTQTNAASTGLVKKLGGVLHENYKLVDATKPDTYITIPSCYLLDSETVIEESKKGWTSKGWKVAF